MPKFRVPDRSTAFLLPPSIDEWLPDGHLARFVADAVHELDLSAIERDYAGCGSKPYHPAMLVALLFYGYATGTHSSRKLEKASYEDIPTRYICANQHPDHDTIATFRKRFMPHLPGVFAQLLDMASRLGLLKVGTVSIDGTKVKANASKHKALSWERARVLEELLTREARRLLELAEEADAREEDEEVNLPAELMHRETRLKKIREVAAEMKERAKERHRKELADYEARLAEREAKRARTGKRPPGKEPKAPDPGPRPKDQVNLTDRDSRIMPSKGTFEQAYNAQLAVDVETGLIVGTHVTNEASDQGQLRRTLQELAERPETLGRVEAVLADAGYFSRENVACCEAENVTPYIAHRRQKHHRTLDEILAPEAPAPTSEDPVERMKERLKTREGRALYARRKSTVEPRIGVIKQVLGFRQFLLRGLDNVHGEWQLVCMAANLKRMHALLG